MTLDVRPLRFLEESAYSLLQDICGISFFTHRKYQISVFLLAGLLPGFDYLYYLLFAVSHSTLLLLLRLNGHKPEAVLYLYLRDVIEGQNSCILYSSSKRIEDFNKGINFLIDFFGVGKHFLPVFLSPSGMLSRLDIDMSLRGVELKVKLKFPAVVDKEGNSCLSSLFCRL